MNKHKIHIRLKKPSRWAIVFFTISVIMAAALVIGAKVTAKRLQTLEDQLAQVQEQVQTATEELASVQAMAEEISAAQAAASHEITLSGPEILARTSIIAHAMGAADGMYAYTNCLEAFQASYAAGDRVFEVDLELTRDGKVVLIHDWSNFDIVPTLEEFLATPIRKKDSTGTFADEQYTPLSFRNLLRLMEQYPDICIITDTKYTDRERIFMQFNSMLADAEELELTDVFDRMIIQLYNRPMREYLDMLYPFSHFIYTMYAEGKQPDPDYFRNLAAYCAETGVTGITMWNSWWNDGLAPIAEEYGLNIYVHTENDPDMARAFLDGGVSAIYTDVLTQEDLK